MTAESLKPHIINTQQLRSPSLMSSAYDSQDPWASHP
jgi:hypothetical protein